MNKPRTRQVEPEHLEDISANDLCGSCNHKRLLHWGVCMLEIEGEFPCDCVDFVEK